MSPEAKAIFFALAVVAFVLAAVLHPRGWWPPLVAGGLALFAFPFFWDALDLATD